MFWTILTWVALLLILATVAFFAGPQVIQLVVMMLGDAVEMLLATIERKKNEWRELISVCKGDKEK